MSALLLDLLALGAAPFIDAAVRGRPLLLAAALDLARVVVAGLVLTHVLPEAADHLGLWAVLAAGAGLWAVSAAERRAHRTGGGAPGLWLMGAALVTHHLLDGGALAVGDAEPGTRLVAATVVHTLPVGLVAWRYADHEGGRRAAVVMLLALAVATTAGFALGHAALDHGTAAAVAAAFLGGTLLHALAHRPHHHHGDPPITPATRRASGLGALAGALVVMATAGGPGDTLAHLLRESAPSLLLGLLAAGALHAWVPAGTLRRVAGSGRLRQAVTGAVAGLPVPICSCGVLPAYEGLVRRGLPGPGRAALGFLVAGPEVGVPALLLSASLLGQGFTAARLAAAAALAVAVALLLGGDSAHEPVPDAAPSDDGPRWREALRYGLAETVDHTAPWVLTGLAVAAALDPLLDPGALAALPSWAAVPLAAAVGVPLYICASGSTPLAAILAAKGVSGGALLALLLTGPATNLTTFGVLSRLHGPGFSWRFGLAVGVGAVALGWTVDAAGLAPTPVVTGHPHEGWLGAVEVLALGTLGLATAAGLLRTGLDGFLDVLIDPLGAADHGDAHEHADACGCGHDHGPAVIPVGPLTVVGPVGEAPRLLSAPPRR